MAKPIDSLSCQKKKKKNKNFSAYKLSNLNKTFNRAGFVLTSANII